MDDEELQRLVETAVASTAERIREHFDISTEAVKHEIQTVADAVVQLEERVGREIGRLDEKIDRGFAETQAMIKFSHVELDRRVGALEETQRMLERTVTDLQSRVERLESTTQ